MGGDTRVSELVRELEGKLEETQDQLEEQEIAGRVLRKMLKECLWESRCARAEAKAANERVAALEGLIDFHRIAVSQ